MTVLRSVAHKAGMSVATLAALVSCVGGGCHTETGEGAGPSAFKVRCAPVTRLSLADQRVVRGVVTAAPDRAATVSSEVAGRLANVQVQEGAAVRVGDVVAIVEPYAYLDALHEAAAQLASAKATRDNAALALDRERTLMRDGVSSTKNLEAAKLALATAEAAMRTAQSKAESAQRLVDRTTVRAPLSGVVTRVTGRSGELVDGTAGTPILEIADSGALELAARAAPAEMLLFRPGQAATVSFGSLPGLPMEATVRAVSPALDQSGVGTVRLTLTAHGLELPLGLFGSATVAIAEARDTIVVPAAALRSGGGAVTEVVLCGSDTARVQPVETGIRRGGVVEIVHGLEPGARVVVGRVTGIAEGMRIEEEPEPRDSESAGPREQG